MIFLRMRQIIMFLRIIIRVEYSEDGSIMLPRILVISYQTTLFHIP